MDNDMINETRNNSCLWSLYVLYLLLLLQKPEVNSPYWGCAEKTDHWKRNMCLLGELASSRTALNLYIGMEKAVFQLCRSVFISKWQGTFRKSSQSTGWPLSVLCCKQVCVCMYLSGCITTCIGLKNYVSKMYFLGKDWVRLKQPRGSAGL